MQAVPSQAPSIVKKKERLLPSFNTRKKEKIEIVSLLAYQANPQHSQQKQVLFLMIYK